MSLTTHRPSPSTVQFTYSLQPRASTSLPTISTIVDLIASFIQSTFILFITQWATICLDTNKVFGPILRYLRHLVPLSDLYLVHASTWHLTPLGMISILCLAFFLFFSKSTPTEESFLIMRSLGVQVTTKMRFPLASHSRFIPASQIDDVFLYEGFKGMEVRYYLAVVVHGEENVEVVFPRLLPQREVLEKVWRTAREVLFKVDDEVVNGAPA